MVVESEVIDLGEVFEVIGNFYRRDGSALRLDAIELEEQHVEIFANIDDEVSEELKGRKRSFGFVHTVWGTKRRILKEKYGIEWRSSGEMNPEVHFD